ncbi:MAG: DNA mismatch repair endonuclease MutL [Treponema sp.]|nr:DNA mismatch repair endonuclease MutL [Treponema sp.]
MNSMLPGAGLQPPPRMIHILPPAEARKIAAGEVIDRPASLAREFIDNALDSGASVIELSIEGGGIQKVEAADNGSGMGREDLALCTKTHATSKIRSLEDLAHAATLGFRGEALAAVSAAARLEILTSTDGQEAWLLKSSPEPGGQDREPEIIRAGRTRGTSVRAFGLFDAIPARKRFLKREATEAVLCRQILVEKALAFPEVAFRFVQDGRLKLHVPSCPAGEAGSAEAARSANVRGLKKRFGELVLDGVQGALLHAACGEGRGFRVILLFGGPEVYRRDRKQQYIFANKRRIQDFGLMQALEYGLTGFFPNGSHPAGAVFVEIDPALADFNIHPAKREVRFADPGSVHHCVSSVLREYVRKAASAYGGSAGLVREDGFTPGGTGPELGFGFFPRYPAEARRPSLAMEALLARRDECALGANYPGGGESQTPPAPAAEAFPEEGELTLDGAAPPYGVRLAGRVFGLFIIAERGERLYLIDQHAAHERILYNHYVSAPAVLQELLVPIPFTVEAGENRFLADNTDELRRLGIILENEGGGAWRIEALPAGWKGGDGGAVEDILGLRGAANLTEAWALTLACRGAIKDGGLLDDEAALTLAKAVLAMEDESGRLPRCPHGRPLWTEISRGELLKAVRRKE